jgi:septal ring factor EnvC (AmiA/AmiB activator)
MSISKEVLIEERNKLQTEFDTVRKEMVQIETQLGQMRSNLNALNGAIQQTNKMLGMFEEEKKNGKKV